MLLGVCLLLSLAIAGCGNGSDAGEFANPHGQALRTPTLTIAPSSLPVRTISLGDFMASGVVPGPHGLLLYGSPKSQGQPTGLPGNSAPYYYDFATKQIHALLSIIPAPAQPTTQQDIKSATIVDDWIVFIEQENSSKTSKLWAINAITLKPTLVDSIQGTTKTFPNFMGFATNGRLLVWSTWSQEFEHLPSIAWYSHLFDTPNSKIPLAAPQYFTGTLQAIEGDTLIISGDYDIPDPTVPGATTPRDAGVYLWTLPSTQPKLLLPKGQFNYVANTRYLLWANLPAETLTLFDIATKHQMDNWVKSCLRPALAPDRPYAVCLDYSRDQLMLVQVPSGKEQPLGVSNDFASGEIADGRAYWVQPARGSVFGDTVAYVDLPTR